MKILKCECKNGSLDGLCEEAVSYAAEEISLGNLVVYPTETVYGIGADIFNQGAVKKLFQVKRRPFDMALSVAVSDRKMMESVAVLDDNADKLIKAFLPGPLTIIIKKQPEVPDIVTSSSQKVGIRIPDHPLALELLKRTGPMVATSANIHSHPDSVEVNAAIDDFGAAVSAYIDCGRCTLGKPSTIVWLENGEIEIIRQGAISREQIKEVLKC